MPLSFLVGRRGRDHRHAGRQPDRPQPARGRNGPPGIGPTRDVIVIDGTASAIPAPEIPEADGDAFAVKTDFDPREEPEPYAYFRIVPRGSRRGAESNELAGRVIMRDGRWAGGSDDA